MDEFSDCGILTVATVIEDFEIKGFLTREMPVKQRFRNPGGLGEVFGGGFGVGFARKKRKGGLNNGRFSFFR